MTVRYLPIGLVMLVLGGFADAGPIYRIVGPDGKVTFSDKPPADAGAQDYEVVRGQTPPATAGSPPGASAAGAAPQAAKRATSADQTPMSAAPPDAALEGAVIGVLGVADIVRQTQAICVNTLPTSFAKYDGIVQHWNERNAPLVARARDALQTRFDAAARRTIEAGIRQKSERSFTPVVEAPANSRIGWCDKSFAAIADGTMDVHNNPKLAGPLAK
jgi:hypothetical protein